jgi:hypothetical protein
MHPEFRRNPLWRAVAVQREPPIDLRHVALQQDPTGAARWDAAAGAFIQGGYLM